MKTVLEEVLERHSQIRSAHQAGEHVVIKWADGRSSYKTEDEALKWASEHVPRCWSWTDSPARNTGRDYCTLFLGHTGSHVGARGEWEAKKA